MDLVEGNTSSDIVYYCVKDASFSCCMIAYFVAVEVLPWLLLLLVIYMIFLAESVIMLYFCPVQMIQNLSLGRNSKFVENRATKTLSCEQGKVVWQSSVNCS